MHQTSDKSRQIAFSVLQDFDVTTQTRQFMKVLSVFLDLEESKVYQKNLIAQKIVQIHDYYRGQYDHYLTQPKFKLLNADAKDFLWSTFKQYDQILNKLKYMASTQPKPMHMQNHIAPGMPSSSNQNMNMNMVNMFVDVPNLQTIEEIQIFQRKMFDIYKNVLPQVLSSMPMSGNQSQFYRNHPYPQQQYGMGAMSSMSGSMSGIGSMTGMPGMPNVQAMNSLGGLGGMSSMAGMSGLGSMGGMPNPNLGGMNSGNSMVGMNSMSNVGYSSKQPQYYQSSSNPFQGRYYFDNKPQNSFSQSMQPNPKNMPGDFRNNPMQGMGFNFCGDRATSDEYGRSFVKGMTPYSQGKINYMPEQYERKAATQKYLNMDDQKYDLGYQSYSPNQHSQLSLQKQFSKFVEKEKQKERERERQREKEFNNNSQLPSNHQPRKLVKKDDQVSIFNDEPDPNAKSQNIVCICNQKNKQEICYYCECVQMDPFNQVDEVLKIQKITPDKSKIIYNVDKKTLQKVHRSPDRLDIEIRCIKIDRQPDGQTCWPQKYRLSIDEEVIDDHISTQTSKKRKDKPFILSKNFGNEKNSQQTMEICLEIKRSQEKTDKSSTQNYLFGIFVVVKHTIQKMYEKILSKMSEKNIKEFFKKQNNQTGQNDAKNEITISPYQPSIKKLIKDPIRGKNCTHAQCFDLEVYLSFLIISPSRQWKCPICGKDAKQFLIDNELKAILADIPKMIKEPKQIVFYSNGSHLFKYEQQKEAEEDKQSKKQKAPQSDQA